MGWEGEERGRARGGPLFVVVVSLIKGGAGPFTAYHFDRAVPGAGAEAVFCDEVPVHGEDLSVVLLPRLDGEFVEADVEELDGPVAGGDDDLVLVAFGPGEVVEGVLGVEPLAPS